MAVFRAESGPERLPELSAEGRGRDETPSSITSLVRVPSSVDDAAPSVPGIGESESNPTFRMS